MQSWNSCHSRVMGCGWFLWTAAAAWPVAWTVSWAWAAAAGRGRGARPRAPTSDRATPAIPSPGPDPDPAPGRHLSVPKLIFESFASSIREKSLSLSTHLIWKVRSHRTVKYSTLKIAMLVKT